MGVTFDNEVTLVCDKNELGWVEKHFPYNDDFKKRREHRMKASHYWGGDAPVWVRTDFNGKVIHLTTNGYGVLDLNSIPLPSSLIGLNSEVWSCQGQDINYVEMVLTDYIKPYKEVDEEDEDDDCWAGWWDASPYEDEKGHLYYDYWKRARKRESFYEDTAYYFEDLMDELKEEDEELLLPLLTEQRDKFAKLAEEAVCEAEDEMREWFAKETKRNLETLFSYQT